MRGKQEKTQELTPEAKEEYRLAKELAAIGTPMYYGPEIAAINEAELGSRANVNSMASALGLQGAGDLSIGAPTATQGGITGYTTYQGAQSALDMLKQFEPGRYEALMKMMINPVTGEMPKSIMNANPVPQVSSSNDDGGFNPPPPPGGPVPQGLKDFASDLKQSLTDSSYDPAGTVFSRTVDKLRTGLLE